MKIGVMSSYIFLYVVFLYAPLLVMPIFAFNSSPVAVFPLSGFSTVWFSEITTDSRLLYATGNSFLVASAVSVIATILGASAAKGFTRQRLPIGNQLLAFVSLPLLIPSLLIGIGLLVVLHTYIKLPLSLFTIGIGHVLLCTPFATLTMMSTFEGMDPSLEEASIDLGKGKWETFKLITIPITAPGFVASFLLCFTVSLDEFLVAYFLSGNEMTLPIYIFSELRFPERLPVLLAMATCMMALTTILLAAVNYLRARRGERDA